MNRTPYSLALESRVSAGPATYRFHTADGVVSKESFRRPELLLLEHLWGTDLGDLLVVEANYGVVGTVLATAAESVHATESSARAATLCDRNANENDADASVSVVADLETLDGRFDTVAYAPKPFTPVAVGKQRAVDALSALRPDGRLYLASAEEEGLGRYESALRTTGASVREVAEDGRFRLSEATHTESSLGTDTPSFVTQRTLTPTVDGVDLSFVAAPGTFSASALDEGTRLLASAARVDDGDRVLDLCCGYGALGAYAGRVADCELWLSDDSRVATRCAERSLRASGVDGTVVTADCVEGVAGRTFDTVLCNPPTHAGAGVLSELLGDVRGLLAPEGRLFLVHHRDLDLGVHLSRFRRVERVREGEDHVVLRAIP
ncbi:methyltransferase [Halobium salinum]|uniref:Methyltransferase n=1 Tax=Halobium salinum TaxID=1364940 RepID=A0ABD5PDT3_9EURY|nr:methyltransferase [Halobium salinum]